MGHKIKLNKKDNNKMVSKEDKVAWIKWHNGFKKWNNKPRIVSFFDLIYYIYFLYDYMNPYFIIQNEVHDDVIELIKE